MAADALTVGAHPRIVPASVAKRNRAAPLLPLWLIMKSELLPLNTVPVGPPATETVSATLAPEPLYSVVEFVPLSDAHHGVVGPALRPQPLTSVASVPGAGVALLSDTSGWTA